MLWAGPQDREQGAEAQHIASGLEVSAAEPESLRKKTNHFKRAQRRRENQCNYRSQQSVSYHGLLPSAAGSAQISETTSLSVTLLSCDLNKALDGNEAVVFL